MSAHCHICLIVSGPNEGGGIERHTRDLATGLADNQRVSVLAHDSFQDLFKEPVEFHAFDLQRWRFNPFLLRSFARKLKELQPNVIHAHGRKAAKIVAATRRATPARRVVTLHNTSKATNIVVSFDAVIAVSSVVAESVSHPNLTTIFNGNG